MARSDRVTAEAAEQAQESLEQATDGRVARRGRNRLAVIDAVIELFSEDNLQPGIKEVALRCGLSPRSVHRYFVDGDALLIEAVRRQLELGYPLYRIHAIGEGPLGHRIDCFTTVRLSAHEVIGATARAAALLGISNARVSGNLDHIRLLFRDQIERQFATELTVSPSGHRRSTVAAIDALFQFESLDYYRQRRGFSLSLAHAMLVETLTDLLDAGEPRPAGGISGSSLATRPS